MDFGFILRKWNRNSIFRQNSKFGQYRDFCRKSACAVLAIHLDHRDIHEELEAMRHSDSEVAALYDKTEAAIILQIPLMTICNLLYP